jgi:diguanylate cyclase (GGDEF)-like protein/PAS domain S-box-containing protein
MRVSESTDRNRLEAILDALQEIVVILGPDGRNLYANSALERILGHRPVDVVGGPTGDRIHPDDLEEALAGFVSIVDKPGASATVRYRSRHKDGRWIPFVAKATNLLHDPEVQGFVITAQDITEEQAAADRFRQIADNASDVIYRLRLDDLTFDYVNAAVTRLTGWTPDEILADGVAAIGSVIHPDDLPLIDRYLRLDFTAPRLETVELRWVHRDGHYTWAEHRFNILRDAENRPIVIDGIARDISSLKAIEKELSTLAQHDELTGLPNRRALLEIIDKRLQYDGSVGVVFLDLDGFKEVNDTLGHDAGDELLTAVAGRLSAGIRADDVVVRFAGDEFVVLTDAAALPWLTERLLDELSSPFALARGEASISASFGTAIGTVGDDPTALLRSADQAMYAAKQSGKARISHAGRT